MAWSLTRRTSRTSTAWMGHLLFTPAGRLPAGEQGRAEAPAQAQTTGAGGGGADVDPAAGRDEEPAPLSKRRPGHSIRVFVSAGVFSGGGSSGGSAGLGGRTIPRFASPASAWRL